MLNIQKMVDSAEACLGWPYVSPGSNDSRGIDCSGLFVKIFRDQGASIYHGSNTIFRKYCSDTGRITDAKALQVGMAVFKWNPNTPEKFHDGLGDFQHIGLVVSVSPLRIIHASTVTMCVTTDTKIGKWLWWGKLKNVDYGSGGSSPSKGGSEDGSGGAAGSGTRVKIVSANGGAVNIRRGNGTQYTRISQAANGSLLDWIATAENGWHAVRTGKEVGWVSPDFSQIVRSGS